MCIAHNTHIVIVCIVGYCNTLRFFKIGAGYFVFGFGLSLAKRKQSFFSLPVLLLNGAGKIRRRTSITKRMWVCSW